MNLESGKKKLLAATLISTALFAGSAAYSTDYTTRQVDLPVSTNDTFHDINTSGENGGAIYNRIHSQITGSEFTKNSSDRNGGAIYNEGTMNITNAVFGGSEKGNKATADGGAIYNAGNMTINGATFGDGTAANANSAVLGGAIATFGNADIIGSTFTSNSATATETNLGGGAVFVGDVSNPVIINSKFVSNTSAGSGGAIATRDRENSGGDTPSSSLYITGDGTAATEFNGNTAATDGGAIWTEVKTVIANTNFTNNIATIGNGGAISHTAADANRLLEIIADGKNVTFSGNTANSVANDIYNTGRLDLVATGSTDTITFGGGITGDSVNNVYGDININKLCTDNNSYKILDGTTVTNKAITAASGTVIFNGDVTTGTLNIGGGKLTNNATLRITGNDSTAITNEFNGTIDGSGSLVIGDGTHTVIASSLGTLSNENITINANASLSADPDNLTVTNTGNTLTNNGELSLTAGTITFNVSGTGHTDIVGNDVKFDTTSRVIGQKINIIIMSDEPDSNSILRAHGSNIGGDVYIDSGKDVSETVSYESTLELTGGTLSHNIYGYTKSSNTTYGDVKILGSEGDVTFAAGKTADVSNLVLNHGKKLINNGTISVRENLAMQPTTTDPVVLAQIENAGTLNLLGGEADDPQNIEGTISGAGAVNIGSYTSEEVKDAAYVVNKGEGSITGNISIAQGSTLKSDSSKTGTYDIKNDGTLIFNNAEGGTIDQNIVKSTAGTGTGVVEIAAAADKVISMAADKAITNNSIKLTSGILDVIAKADTNGNIAAETFGSGIIANGGTLSVQDDKTGNINLGAVNTSGASLKVVLDIKPHSTSSADILKATGVTGTNGIDITKLNVVEPASAHTEFDVLIADNNTKGHINLSNTTINAGDAGNLLVTYAADTGNLHGAHSDLENAIISEIAQKVYAPNVVENLSNAANLTLGGTSLSVSSPNAYTVKGGDKAITLANDGQTLSIKSEETSIGAKFEDFTGTVINNAVGGTVNLKNVTMSNTSTSPDIINDGEGTKGLFIEGRNKIGSIKDSAGTVAKGQTTISSGVSNITTIAQKSVTVGTNDSAAILNIRGDGSTTTTPSLNASTLTINKTSDGTMSEVENGGNIVANTITNSGKLTNNENAKITATNGITSTGEIFNTATGSSITANITNNGVGQIETNVDNFTGTIENNANPTSTEQNAGLNLHKGTTGVLSQAITGTGTTSIIDDVTVAASGSITQGTVNVVGKLSTPATLTNNSTIVANNIKASNGNALVLNGGSTTQADSIILNSTSLTVNDGAALKDKAGTAASNIKATNSNINLNANNDNTTFNANLVADSYANSINTNSASDKTVTIDSVISENAIVPINAQSGNLALTKNTINSLTGANIINMGGGTKLTLDSTGGDVELKAVIKDAGGYDSVIIAGPNKISVSSEIADSVNGINVNDGSTLALLDKAEINKNNVTLGDGSKLAVSASDDEIFINGDIKGKSGATTTSAFDINKSSGNADVIVGGTISDTVINVGAGSLILEPNATLANSTQTTIDSGAKLGTMNKNIQTIDAPITFAAGSKLDVDADIANGTSDKFTNVTGAPQLNDMYLVGVDKITSDSATMNLTKNIGIDGLTASDSLASNIANKYSNIMTPIRRMQASISTSPEGDLLLGMTGTGNGYNDFNPSIMASPVAAQMGGYLSQLNSYEQAFQNLDMKMLMTREERQAYKMANRYASEVQPKVFSPTYLPEKDSAGWFRPYASFEHVNLKGGPNVENIMYGSYFGGDSQMKELRNGWDFQYSVYIGYNGSHQNYQGNSIYQNGGNLGATGIWYKDDFFTALTANVGASVADASTMYGSEDFPMLMTGVASKTGYNWELAKGKFIIQPSWLMSYTFVNTFDYTNAAGVRIKSDPLHAINMAPGVKFIGNLKHGWQPYVSMRMVWNIMDQTDFHANNVSLPELSVKPYFQYGVGLQKRWGDRFTGFFQAMFRNGGRNGVALSLGFRWAIGKDYHSYPDYKPKNKTSNTIIKKTATKNTIKKPTKLGKFIANMDGDPTYVVTVKK